MVDVNVRRTDKKNAAGQLRQKMMVNLDLDSNTEKANVLEI